MTTDDLIAAQADMERIARKSPALSRMALYTAYLLASQIAMRENAQAAQTAAAQPAGAE